ncbi:MAG: VCBS repeat-containing protein [Chitinophagaceae bacterium]|nr:VCBS repeat-containing protein [Chitinophagaceae bacterium]
MVRYKSCAYVFIACALIAFSFFACTNKKSAPALFEVLNSDKTGLDFANHLNSTDSLNLFKYMYFYNGAGVAAGDFNNDGLIDLYFASNQGDNSLYLNKGNLRFRNVTAECGIPLDKAWSTGVSVVDINNDGLLDIYVSRVGKYRSLISQNQFLICTGIDKNGVPHYVDRAREYGLDFSGFGTQAAFLDYDMDGDLDIFLLNHSVHENGTFRARNEFMGTFHPTTGSRLFRNDGNTFTDVTKACGINSSAIGYGLGIAVSDINLDGYPDIYIGNDFHENDYMYINQHDGTFKDELVNSVMHTSQFTMGVDIADANNDGYPEIITMDMLPSDPYILKRSLGEDAYDIFNLKISYGYNYQYTRNNLQYNKRNGNFSETGLYSGVAATDWSWSPLWMDFDNDGLKDLFISNGIPKRMNDIDYINYISDEEIQQKIRDNKIDEKDKALIDKFPQIKIPNKFFKNSGNMHFEDLADQIGDDVSTYSNGAVYADLDNDGDLDIVVNNIDEDAIVYQNKSNDRKDQSYVQLKLKGPQKNINAIGSKAILFTKDGVRTYEKSGVHGFLSSMEIPMHIGLDSTKTDSAFFVWPDNSYQPLTLNNPHLTVEYKKGLPIFNYNSILTRKKNNSFPVADITKDVGLSYAHTENSFAEFDRDPLIPHMVSTEGPGLAVGDINKDGLQDVFIGSSKGYKSGVFIQQPDGKFIRVPQPSIELDSSYEDVDACWVDLNNDSNVDLVVASGGNEYYGNDKHLLPRVYLNDGTANLVRKVDAFDSIYQTASCVVANDFNGDGFQDLFIGGRVVPWEYGKQPPSYLLANDGTGKFRDVTKEVAPELSEAGFVTKALWFDIDKDNDKDLIVCSEWGTIDAYINTKGKFVKKVLFNKRGWWNFILPCDINGDGNIDFIAGNLGLNSRLHASEKQPVRLYYNDFDDNGKKEQVLTYYLDNKEIPFPNKAEMERQMPVMRKRFLYAKDFAQASLGDILTSEKMESAEVLTADYFQNCILINKGGLNFDAVPLPWEAQLTSYRDAVVVNANHDSLPDVLLVGNYYGNNIEMGRYDADFGSLLINNGKGGFNYENLNGLAIKGQSRSVKKILVKNKDAYVIAKNNDTAMVIRFLPYMVK